MMSDWLPDPPDKRAENTSLRNEHQKCESTKENRTPRAASGSEEIDEPEKADKKPDMATEGDDEAEEISGIVCLLTLLLLGLRGGVVSWGVLWCGSCSVHSWHMRCGREVAVLLHDQRYTRAGQHRGVPGGCIGTPRGD